MNRFKKFVFVLFAVLLLSGCSTSNGSSKAAIVNDEEVKSLLESHVISLQVLPKTLELYTKGSGEAKDYSAEEKIAYGLEKRITSAGLPTLDATKIQSLQVKGITNVSTYISVSDVENNVEEVFGPISFEHKNITGCPNYIYDEADKVYYVQTNCTVEAKPTIVSYIDKVTNKDNLYYVTVYAGLIENNKVYADFNKSEVVKDLSSDELYEISDETKEQFTKFTYTFTKNSNGQYVFTSLKK